MTHTGKRHIIAGAAVLAAFLCAAAPAVQSAETLVDGAAVRVLTLGEALEIAAEKSRDIEKARELKNRYEGIYVQERAAALPQVTGSLGLGLGEDEATADLNGRSSSTAYTTAGDIEVRQVLFTWGQVGAAIRAAKIGLLTADDELRAARQSAALDVTAAFYDVLLARELNALALQNLEQKRRHLDEAKKKYAAGVATDYDVLAAEVSVKNASPEVIRTENLIRLGRDRLRNLLAFEGELDVTGSLDVVPGPWPGYDEALASAHANRPELAQLRHTIGVSDELITVAGAGDKPRVDFKAGFGRHYIEQDSGPDGEGNVWSVGVFATWPVFDGLRTRGRVAQAKSEAASLRIEEKKLLDAVSLGVRDAENRVREADGIMKALEGAVAEAERLLAMAEKGYEYGVKTRLDVDDAQLNLTQARSSHASSRRNYLVARATLEFMMGILGEKG